MSGVLRAGDRVQLTGPKGRLNTITLEAGGVFHSHKGALRHDDVIGLPEGSVVTGGEAEYLVLRPLLSDFVLSMPRGAAIVYPKDAAQIIAQADIGPGDVVVEAGVGSGALSLWLLRAVGERGRLISFERREEFADIARANAASFLGGPASNWSITLGDLAEQLPAAVEPAAVDRVVLDMLAPWECVDACANALRPGGVIIAYVATATQLSRVTEALRDHGGFTPGLASETMVRTWHVDGLAVRPDHRMIAHTGFLVAARRLADGAVLPERKRPRSKTRHTDADVEAWTPGALGMREESTRSLRKKVRQSTRTAQQTTDPDAAID